MLVMGALWAACAILCSASALKNEKLNISSIYLGYNEYLQCFMNYWGVLTCQTKSKLKKKNQKTKDLQENSSLHLTRLFESETNMCLCHYSLEKAQQSIAEYMKINSLGKSFAGHSWKAKKVISMFSPLQMNHPAAFQKVKWSQKEVDPMEKLSSVRLSSVTSQTGDLTHGRTEGEEWRVFIQKESTNRENLPSEKAKSTISFLPVRKQRH